MSIDKEREAFIADCKELFGWVSGCSGYDDAATELFNRMQARAALSAPNHSEQVREGWKLVPVKPSIDMVEAGYEASLGRPDRGSYARVIEQYDAMLAAAPSPASQKEQGE